mgnify:CR=1 FL=1
MKVILLVGAPRCGKTQLALQMCENKRSVFYDVRSSSLKSFLEHIDTNVDVMVFDDIRNGSYSITRRWSEGIIFKVILLLF